MINKCHNWQVTRTQCYAGDGSDRSEPRQTLQRRGGGEGGLFVVWTLTPPTATDRGGAHPVSCGSLDPHPLPPSVLDTQPRGCRRVSLLTPRRRVLNWNAVFGPSHPLAVAEERRRQHRPAWTGLACRGPQQFPANLVCTILYSPSPRPPPRVSPAPLPWIAKWRNPVGVCIWDLYKCTSLRKKMKPWHICNHQVPLSLLGPKTKRCFFFFFFLFLFFSSSLIKITHFPPY